MASIPSRPSTEGLPRQLKASGTNFSEEKVVPFMKCGQRTERNPGQSLEGNEVTPNATREADLACHRTNLVLANPERTGEAASRPPLTLIGRDSRPMNLKQTNQTMMAASITQSGAEWDVSSHNAGGVSLSVKSGVLSVENVLDGQQVDGQGQSELNISSSNLTQLNDLLSRVTYTSIIYHIYTTDMAHFSFEDHEAIFPIMIRRSTVPVLYDPGKDINSQVTIITKTFLRYKELKVLIQSIREFYPNIKIIVADDSLNPEDVSGNNIEHYIMPPAQGWFAGRNLALSQLTTKYFLWVDDDFEFLKETRIESFVEIMEAIPDLDVVGGEVSGDQFHFILEYDEGTEKEGGCLRRIKGGFHQPLSGYNGCFFVDGVTNFFLGRTEAVQRIGFDPFLKRVGHTEFFIDALGKLLVVSCKGLSIGHQTHREQNQYDSYRTQEKIEEERKLAHHFFKNYLQCINLHPPHLLPSGGDPEEVILKRRRHQTEVLSSSPDHKPCTWSLKVQRVTCSLHRLPH
ncbi:Beta-1,4 N-acetylgalactosaminyltransferase 2 [Anabarilius grahami]|uniref:Beta-1,4 N-acetylgalactosaminyltransferase 2 n=1 Tax=Anabarilius grahami TaxID=495550 RepID=A0A3N0YJK0_ANAGA|nr:Beta-1,4 N-acetylgalactosaminyltransferase 2 [Anabarilius grahami]